MFTPNKKKNLKIFFFSFLVFLLSLFLILLLLKFGLPLIISISSLFFNRSSSGSSYVSLIPRPAIFLPYEATNSAEQTVTGKAFINGTVKVYLNNEEIKTLEVKNQEDFSVQLSLNPGENAIYAIQETLSGQKSLASEIFSVMLDIEPPNLEVLSPANEAKFTGSQQKLVNFSGVTDEEALVFVNNRQAIVKNGGKFNLVYGLDQGENKIKVVAVDLAGNRTEKELTLFFQP